MYIMYSYQIYIIGLSIFFITMNLKDDETHADWFINQSAFITTIYVLFLVFYIVEFIKLIRSLSEHYPNFYAEEKTKIFLSNSMIIVSIISRIIFNFLYSSPSFIHQIIMSWQQNTILYSLTQFLSFLLSNFLPQLALLLSLMHMLLRQQDMLNQDFKEIDSQI